MELIMNLTLNEIQNQLEQTNNTKNVLKYY